MTKKLILAISLAVNVVFITIAAIYLFTPYFDFKIAAKILGRMCNYAQQNNTPEVYASIKICHINE